MRCKAKNMVYNLPGVDNDPEYTQGQRNHSSGLVL